MPDDPSDEIEVRRKTDRALREVLAQMLVEFRQVGSSLSGLHERISRVESHVESLIKRQDQQIDFEERITRLEERLNAAIAENTKRVDNNRFLINLIAILLGGGILALLMPHLH